MRLCATLYQGQITLTIPSILHNQVVWVNTEYIYITHPKMSKLNDIIKLSIGGKEFKTTRGTLVADQKSMLARMFEKTDDSAILPAASKDENGAYFIDRDPRYFNVVLNFLRTGVVEINETIDLNFLLLEANYYGIDGMIEKIEQSKKAREDEQNQKFSQIIYEMQNIANEIQSQNTSNEIRRTAYEMVTMNQELSKMSRETTFYLEKIDQNTSSFKLA